MEKVFIWDEVTDTILELVLGILIHILKVVDFSAEILQIIYFLVTKIFVEHEAEDVVFVLACLNIFSKLIRRGPDFSRQFLFVHYSILLIIAKSYISSL